MIFCAPIIRLVTSSVYHHVAQGARHLTHPLVHRIGKAIRHAVKAGISPTVRTSLVCKAISMAMIGGTLLTAAPTNAPLLLDNTASTAKLGPPVDRGSATAVDSFGQGASFFAIFDKDTNSVTTDSESPKQATPGAYPVPSPFAFHWPPPETGNPNLGPVVTLADPPLGLNQGDLPSSLPENQGPLQFGSSVAPVAEPPSGFMLVAAVTSLFLLRSATSVFPFNHGSVRPPL